MTHSISCSMTFTEFDEKIKHYRNNSGPSRFAAWSPNNAYNYNKVPKDFVGRQIILTITIGFLRILEDP